MALVKAGWETKERFGFTREIQRVRHGQKVAYLVALHIRQMSDLRSGPYSRRKT